MPNSSTSSSGAGIDAQLIETNGALAFMARVVDAARDEFLAGSSFAGQQQRAKWSRRDAARHVQRVAHPGAFGDDGRRIRRAPRARRDSVVGGKALSW